MGDWDYLQAGEEACPLDPWIIVPDKSKYVDQQTLKLQENPEVLILILMKKFFFLMLNGSFCLIDWCLHGY